MKRTSITIDEELLRKARKLTKLRTTREIVDRALTLLVYAENRKGIINYYGSGVWRGDAKRSRAARKLSTYLEDGPVASKSFMEGVE